MMINIDNPTISTALAGVRRRGPRRAGLGRGRSGSDSIEVAVTTLDALIDAHGVPSFIKIDVEGFEGRRWRA